MANDRVWRKVVLTCRRDGNGELTREVNFGKHTG